MKLFNVIVIYDVYVVAESGEAAQAAILDVINSSDLKPSETVGFEVTREQAIRARWRDEKPFVAADISGADFAKLKGKTTVETFTDLYTKVAPNG